jgi:hypothetical protein
MRKWMPVAVKERKMRARWKSPHNGKVLEKDFLHFIARMRDSGEWDTSLRYTDATITMLYRDTQNSFDNPGPRHWMRHYGVVPTPEVEQIKALFNGEDDAHVVRLHDRYAQALIAMCHDQLSDFEQQKLDQLSQAELVSLVMQLAYTANRLVHGREQPDVWPVKVTDQEVAE